MDNNKIETMFTILIIGLMAGFYRVFVRTPTVFLLSPLMSVRIFSTKVSILNIFFALSQAPPPDVIEIAINP